MNIECTPKKSIRNGKLNLVTHEKLHQHEDVFNSKQNKVLCAN